MSRQLALTVFLVSTCGITNMSWAQDAVAVSPEIYTVLFENDQIRVLEVTYGPGERDAPHSHPKYAITVLEGGTLRVHTAAGEPEDRTVQPDETTLLDPVARHWGENVGDSTIRAIAVEFKTQPPEDTVSGADCGSGCACHPDNNPPTVSASPTN